MSYARHNQSIRKPLAMREGYSDFIGGYVTTLISVIDRTPAELESRLGYGPRALARGFALYFLIQGVGPNEFRWRGRTRHAAGWTCDSDAGEAIQWADKVRWAMASQPRSAAASDQQFDLLMVAQQQRLNVRTGSERIVKVVPLERGSDYPDAPGRGVPQWELLTRKEFRCAARVAPGARYRGGAAGRALLGADT